MRPRDLLKQLQMDRQALTEVRIEKMQDGLFWKVAPLRKLEEGLVSLNDLPFFQPAITHLHKTVPSLFEDSNKVFVTTNEGAELQLVLASLVESINAMIGLLESMIEPDDPCEFSFRLPSDVSSPAQLQDDLDALVALLDNIPRRLVHGGITFRRVEAGSNWFVFLADNVGVFALIVSIIGVVQNLVAKREKHKGTLLELKGLAIHLQVQQALADSYRKLQDEQVAQILLQSSLAIDQGAKNEAAILLSNALDKACSMYERGATIMLSTPASHLSPDPRGQVSAESELTKLAMAALTQGKSEGSSE